jgi:hypothetical protein
LEWHNPAFGCAGDLAHQLTQGIACVAIGTGTSAAKHKIGDADRVFESLVPQGAGECGVNANSIVIGR